MYNRWGERASEVGMARGFVAGLIIGGLAGAGTMLLLAPESGRRTRAGIQQKGMELRDQAVETVENTMADARGKAREFTAPAIKQAEALQQRGQEIVKQQRDRAMHGLG